jgi:hypothetical protein
MGDDIGIGEVVGMTMFKPDALPPTCKLNIIQVVEKYFRRLKPAATKTERIDFAHGSRTL